jgi:hypothetical protein
MLEFSGKIVRKYELPLFGPLKFSITDWPAETLLDETLSVKGMMVNDAVMALAPLDRTTAPWKTVLVSGATCTYFDAFSGNES